MAIQENPYLPPASRVADAATESGGYIDGGRTVASSHAGQWLTRGWKMFRRQVGIWILLTLVFGGILIALNFIPLLGSIAVTLLMPVFVAGLMVGCQKVEHGEELELAHLFAGFQHHAGALMLVGLIGLGLTIAALVPAMLMAGMTGFAGAIGGGTVGAASAGVMLGALMFFALVIPINMALWFAPALVALQGQSATRALAQSFTACLRNVVPFLVYSLILFGLAIVASIPLGLGWLVLAPVIIGSVYAAYRDIFFER